MYKSFCKHMLSFLLGKYLGLEFTGPQSRYIFMFIRNYQTIFKLFVCFLFIDYFVSSAFVILKIVSNQFMLICNFYMIGPGLLYIKTGKDN